MRFRIWKLEDDGKLMGRPWKVRSDGNTYSQVCKTWREAMDVANEHLREIYMESHLPTHKSGRVLYIGFN